MNAKQQAVSVALTACLFFGAALVFWGQTRRQADIQPSTIIVPIPSGWHRVGVADTVVSASLLDFQRKHALELKTVLESQSDQSQLGVYVKPIHFEGDERADPRKVLDTLVGMINIGPCIRGSAVSGLGFVSCASPLDEVTKPYAILLPTMMDRYFIILVDPKRPDPNQTISLAEFIRNIRISDGE